MVNTKIISNLEKLSTLAQRLTEIMGEIETRAEEARQLAYKKAA